MTDAELAGAPGGTIVIFDGVCNLCTGAVRFLMRRDRRRRFRFAALQSAAGQELLDRHGLREDTLPKDSLQGDPATGVSRATIVVIEAGRARVRSDAALLLARRLPWPWPMLAVLLVLPKPVRDAVYALVARHRYRWFGRSDTCMVPTPESSDRFLE